MRRCADPRSIPRPMVEILGMSGDDVNAVAVSLSFTISPTHATHWPCGLCTVAFPPSVHVEQGTGCVEEPQGLDAVLEPHIHQTCRINAALSLEP
eukprot:38457-Chlamydomonas_euryale.AAC.3